MDHTYASGLVKAQKAHARKAADFYPTPPDVTHALMRFLNLDRGAYIWEPACGDGAMAKAIAAHGHEVVASDLREDSGYGEGGFDFLDHGGGDRLALIGDVDWIITNPPFNLAAQFIEKALSITPNVAMLLKSQFWHAKTREPLFRKHPPAWVLPLTWRPAFLEAERGGSPMMDVCWVVWSENQDGATRYDPLLRPTAAINTSDRQTESALTSVGTCLTSLLN